MPAFKGEKCRVNLRLCINRLKLLEKKKSELTLFITPFNNIFLSQLNKLLKLEKRLLIISKLVVLRELELEYVINRH